MHRTANNPFLHEHAARRAVEGGFTLLEVLTALAILALASSSVLLVIDRCVNSASDSARRMEAFQLARENLEQVLIRDSVEESVEYGTSDIYPDMSWQTVIEAFPEPVNGQMWVRAVCTAEYKDSKDQDQKVELTHWIAELTDQQAGALMSEEEMAKLEAEQTLTTASDAAKYARINAETLQQWVDNGLLMTEDGGFFKYNLDLFIDSNGEPSEQDKAKQVESIEELAMALRTTQKELEEGVDQSDSGTDRSSEQDKKKTDVDDATERVKQRQK
jgi:prepilin-type N-terminal cleavage/methylation domain-containing protein